MAIRSDEIISIIKSQIESFDATTETHNVGTVIEVGDGIARICGLAEAVASELLEFPGGVMGLALNLEEETVGAVILGTVRDPGGRPGPHDRPGRRGARRRRADGRVVNALGEPIDGKGPIPRPRPARSSASRPAWSAASPWTRPSRPASRRSTR